MGIFTQLGFDPNLIKEPERLTPDEARQRRLFSELDRQRKVLEDQPERLSQAYNSRYLNQLKEFQTKFSAELEARRKRDQYFQPESRAYQANRSRLLQLVSMQSMLQTKASLEAKRRYQFQKSFVDRSRSQFDPTRADTIWQTIAWITEANFHRYPSFALRFRQKFMNRGVVVPCIQRVARREVMFAKRKAGRGYRVPHKRGPLSNIGC